jgi:photosystem II stability/assembly factor-like uncharacterized protein
MKTLLLIALFVLPKMLHAQWQECPAPNQGSIIQLATFGNYIWAGTTYGGVYRTNNQQSNWEVQNDGLSGGQDKLINCMKVINGSLYVGCRGGLYKKSSVNASWVQLLNYYYPTSDVCSGGGNVLLAGMYGTIRRSVDGGLTWQDSNAGLPTTGSFSVNNLEYDPATGEIIANLMGTGLYHSTNQGLTWSPINYPGNFSPTAAFVTMLKMENNVMYAGVEPQGLFSWNTITGSWQLVAQASGRITDMIIVNNKYLTTTSYGIQMFPMLGSGMFTTVVANASGFLTGSLSLEQSGNQIYIGGMNECALMIDTALQAYSYKKEGMKSSPTEWISGDGTHLFTHADQEHFYYTSTDEFTSTSIFQDLEPYYLGENLVDINITPQKWYLVRNSRGVDLSYDHGQTAIKANNGLPPTTFQTYFLSAISRTNAGYMILGTRDGKFYKTVNDSTWSLICDLFSSTEKIDKIIQAGNYLFAGTQNVLLPSAAHVYRSSDNGQTWQVMPGPFQNGMSVYGLTYDGNRVIAAGSGYGTWASTDFGNTWTHINDGLPQYNVFRTIKSFNGDAYGITEISKQLYRLAAGDTTWNCVNCTTGSPLANEVFIQNGTLFIGTPDYGIYKWPNYITGIEEPQNISSVLYPNPSKNCQIELTNDYALPLTIKVYDLQGKTVYAETINDYRKTIYLNAGAFKTGVYTVQLIYNSGKSSLKKWLVD